MWQKWVGASSACDSCSAEVRRPTERLAGYSEGSAAFAVARRPRRNIVRVGENFISRWEAMEGRGSCPDSESRCTSRSLYALETKKRVKHMAGISEGMGVSEG